jgi:hypothetical protein
MRLFGYWDADLAQPSTEPEAKQEKRFSGKQQRQERKAKAGSGERKIDSL